jgi:pyruvate ferredoxin oxidoreductase alpha subunit
MTATLTPMKDAGSEREVLRRMNPREPALADAVARCRPVVIGPSVTVDGDVIAAAIDACGTGRTVYTAVDGEGMLRMARALFRASHLGLPIVMTVGSSPGRRDHEHAMALRDCGWVQLYPTDDQDAVDTHIQAFRIAASLCLPVMVCMDTFTRARATDRPQVPPGDEIQAFLRCGDSLDRPNPLSPDRALEMHMEMRYLTHAKQSVALRTIRQVAADFRERFGRPGGVLITHKLWGAKVVVLGLGSTFEAITAAVDVVRGHGVSVGAVGLRSFRPFPTQDVGAALLHCERVVIVERAMAVGIGGIVSTDVRSSLVRLPIQTHSVIAGLGDRTIPPESLQLVLYKAARGTLEELSFLDVNRDLMRSSGSHAISHADKVPTRRDRHV